MRHRLVPVVLGAAAALVVALVVVAGPVGAETLTYETTVSGANEVPANASAGTGSVTITVDTVTNEVCVDATAVTGLSGAVAADHIHQAAAGVNGPIVIDFVGSLDTCVAGAPATVAALVATPSDFYFNMHTGQFPGGEVRGQLGQPVPPSSTTTTTSTVAPSSSTTAAATTSTTAPPAVAPVTATPRFTG